MTIFRIRVRAIVRSQFVSLSKSAQLYLTGGERHLSFVVQEKYVAKTA
ncbi:hypothetical protein [Nostoc sp. UHCC 0252]|nr:hypothetical protein [Nostoc sp. UHCC 0252]MEA5601038.1 hypothetical protein [Nostoc sp. UHCC 0252]